MRLSPPFIDAAAPGLKKRGNSRRRNSAPAPSFLPDDFLPRKQRLRSNVICGLLTGIVIVVLAMGLKLSNQLNQQATSDNAAAQVQYASAAQEILRVRHAEARQQKLSQETELCQALSQKVLRSVILAEITNNLPSGIELSEFDLRQAPPDLAMQNNFDDESPMGDADRDDSELQTSSRDRSEAEIQINLAGRATSDASVNNYVASLNRSPLLREVTVAADDDLGGGARNFKLEMAVNVDDADQ